MIMKDTLRLETTEWSHVDNDYHFSGSSDWRLAWRFVWPGLCGAGPHQRQPDLLPPRPSIQESLPLPNWGHLVWRLAPSCQEIVPHPHPPRLLGEVTHFIPPGQSVSQRLGLATRYHIVRRLASRKQWRKHNYGDTAGGRISRHHPWLQSQLSDQVRPDRYSGKCNIIQVIVLLEDHPAQLKKQRP